MSDCQHTLSKPAELTGIGLHTGASVTCRFLPAEPNTGIRFKRTDVEGQPEIPADVDLVTDTNRGTTLSKQGVSVHTVEHVMAALAGLGIDNTVVELNGPEIPIMDGSAWPFVEVLQKAGIVAQQDAPREYFVLPENIFVEDNDKKVEIIGIPDDHFRVSVTIDFDSHVLVTQSATYNNGKSFATDIAKARTFVFLHELEFLVQNNLVKGGDVSNAIVFVEEKVNQEKLDELARIMNKPKIKVNGSGTLNNVTLHYANEPARHKLLDLIGDLALIGMPIRGNIIASRPGHTVNIAFAKKVKQLIKDEKAGKIMPYVDMNKKPLYDIHQIMEFLPHRYPFLLVDKIMELGEDYVVGVKNVTMNEPFFVGHFPGNPVMPGVMQIEAMAQVGGILVMNTVDDPKNYTPYFIKIENVKFKQRVQPGDTVVFILRLKSPIRRGICHMEGRAYVDGKAVMEAEMMAQIVKNN